MKRPFRLSTLLLLSAVLSSTQLTQCIFFEAFVVTALAGLLCRGSNNSEKDAAEAAQKQHELTIKEIEILRTELLYQEQKQKNSLKELLAQQREKIFYAEKLEQLEEKRKKARELLYEAYLKCIEKMGEECPIDPESILMDGENTPLETNSKESEDQKNIKK
ncbi:hypothetical protein KJZ61_04325 [Candidatus Dependentiae bacterium]|nr:hypothetical protein [Candidatus Dependentiae bacterium]